MSELFTSAYGPLFEVRLLHHYWLDDGAIAFDDIASDATRSARLLDYDVRQFLDVVPTAATETALSGYGCLFKNQALGFLVATGCVFSTLYQAQSSAGERRASESATFAPAI